MVLDPSANFVRQSLGSSVGTNDPETIDVSDASAFPDPSTNQYNLVVWDTAAGRPDQDSNREIVRVTGRDTGADTLTVARAQEGTSNETHPNTSAVQLANTAKLRDDTDSAVESLGSFSGTPPTIDEVTVNVNNELTQSSQFNNVYTPQTPDQIVDAVDKVNNNGEGRIILPQTDPRMDLGSISLPLDINVDGVMITGHGRLASRFNTRGDTFLRFTNNTYKHSSLANFSITMASATPGIFLNDFHGNVDNIRVFGDGGGRALNLQGCYGTRISRCWFQNNSEHILGTIGSTGNTRIMIWRNQFKNATGPNALRLDDSGTAGGTTTPTIAQNLFISNAERAIHLLGVDSPWIFNNRFEMNDSSDSNDADIFTNDDSQGDDTQGGFIRENLFVRDGSGNAIQLRNATPYNDPPGMVIAGNKFDNYTNATVIRSTSSGVEVCENAYVNGTNPVADQGVRTIRNGVGSNSGDPSAGGDWNGNGYEGVVVRDTSNGNTYLYNNGVWSQIASA